MHPHTPARGWVLDSERAFIGQPHLAIPTWSTPPHAQGKKSTLRAARSLLYRHGVRVLRTTEFFQASPYACLLSSKIM